MHWRNREKRNDQEHHVKASFFHLADKTFFLHFHLLVILFFIQFLLLVLFAHVSKHSNSRSQVFFKTGVLKNFAILYSQENTCVGAAF